MAIIPDGQLDLAGHFALPSVLAGIPPLKEVLQALVAALIALPARRDEDFGGRGELQISAEDIPF